MSRELDDRANLLLKGMMRNCRAERKSKTRLSNRSLAAKLAITENYVCALESARAQPSIRVLLKYLIASGFDVGPLLGLTINDANEAIEPNKVRAELIRKIYSFDEAQLAYLLDQVALAESFDMKRRIPAKSKSR